MIEYHNYTYEQIAHALYMKGLEEGFRKITDKTGWRENVIGEKLNHEVYKTISSGCNSDGEGSDAKCNLTGNRAEYKTKALETKNLRNLFQRTKPNGKGKYAPLRINGVYNNAMKPGALDLYKTIDHYFGCFYREQCILVIKVNTEHVISQLKSSIAKKKKNGSTTTNLCSAVVSLADTHLYEIAYKNNKWFKENA